MKTYVFVLSAVCLCFSLQTGAAAAAAGLLEPGSELTLSQAITIGLHNHPLRKEATSETQATTDRVGEAQSFLLPQLYGTAEYLRSTNNGIGNTSYYNFLDSFPRVPGRNHNLPSNDFSQSTMSSNNYLGGLSVSQFLFDFGRRRGFVAQRRDEAAASLASARLTDLDLIFEVSQRYFALLAAKQLVRVYEKAVEQRQFHLHEARVKANAGLRPRLDIYVTQAEVERAQLHLVDARNAQLDAKVALDNALGLSGSNPSYHLADVLTYGTISDQLPGLLQTAFNDRPDIKVLEDRARAMGAQIVQYRSDYFPTASLQSGYTAMGTGLPAANNFDVGFVISWPLFNGYLTTNEIDEAKARRQATQYALDDLRQRIILEVKTAFLNWQASLDRINRAQQTLIASRVELELAEKRYQAGLTNIVELEDAQRHYTYDDAEYANSLYGFSLTKAVVDRATGRSLKGE
ncbi:MAG TPA: TolC family protein [Candidatus Binataceae bacterium]|nr:TolC family protein [Candidatus Binataceae bacterium]